jgi:hypothetical protein
LSSLGIKSAGVAIGGILLPGSFNVGTIFTPGNTGAGISTGVTCGGPGGTKGILGPTGNGRTIRSSNLCIDKKSSRLGGITGGSIGKGNGCLGAGGKIGIGIGTGIGRKTSSLKG